MSEPSPSQRVRVYVTHLSSNPLVIGRWDSALARLTTAMPQEGGTILKVIRDEENKQLRLVVCHPDFPPLTPGDRSFIITVNGEAREE